MDSRDKKTAGIMRQCRRIRSAATLVLFCLAVLVLLERFGWIPVAVAKGEASRLIARRAGLSLSVALPEAFYLCALWWIRSAFSGLAAGEFFAAALTRMLRRVGGCVVAGAIANVAILPSLERLFGADPGYWIALDAAGVTLAVIGALLIVLAGVLDQAQELKTELDGIF